MNQRRFSREATWLLKEKYKGKATQSAKGDLVRLQAGEPVDYVIGFVEFAGCKIDLSLKPLIPRPETEYWVGEAVADIQSRVSPYSRVGTDPTLLRVLDVFSGSGCIGIAVLKHVQRAQVDFAEKEKQFLKQIGINAKLNRINPHRYHIIESDIFQPKNRTTVRSIGWYDYIFANPPYVAESRKQRVQPSVLNHEPSQALFAGKDGLSYIRKFLKEAKNHLSPGGKIYLEFDSPQKREIEKLLESFGYKTWQFHKDQYKKWRFVVVLF